MPSSRAGRAFRTIALLTVVGLVAGCTSWPRHWDFPAASTGTYAIESGDEIAVNFRLTPEYDGTQIVRPDGMIWLSQIGETRAAGLTPAKLAEELRGAYSSKLKQPEIAVLVMAYRDRPVYIGGQVARPGETLVSSPMTLVNAIVSAGGFDDMSANMKRVIVMREVAGKRYATTVNVKKLLYAPEAESFRLAPGDIVYVPRTKIDRVDQWVDQYINRLLPNPGGAVTASTVAGP